MSETTGQYNLNELSNIYGQLNSQDIEQFYAGYQWWNLQQRAATLQAEIEDLRREIAANAELMEMVHPPAIALATLARLQAGGVKDIALLDRMLERGEDWLDRTMQRLDYCEQVGFILDDYTQWCQSALEGAYDWIDSMREGPASSSPEAPTNDAASEATEELLLQKLTSEDEEQLPSQETAHPQADLPAPQEPAPALAEPLINDERSDAASVGARFIAPQGRDEETVPDLATTAPEEDTSPSEKDTITIEDSQNTPETNAPSITALSSQSAEKTDTLKTPSDFEETTLQPQEEQPSQLPQVSQSVEINSTTNTVLDEPPMQETVEPEPGPAEDDEQPTQQEHSQPSPQEASESEQLISQVYREFDPAPEGLPSVEGNDGSDFRHFPLQEHFENTASTEEAVPSLDESAMYWEESPPYRTYPPDKQPGIEADNAEHTEQDRTPTRTPKQKRNFLQRLATKIWAR